MYVCHHLIFQPESHDSQEAQGASTKAHKLLSAPLPQHLRTRCHVVWHGAAWLGNRSCLPLPRFGGALFRGSVLRVRVDADYGAALSLRLDNLAPPTTDEECSPGWCAWTSSKHVSSFSTAADFIQACKQRVRHRASTVLHSCNSRRVFL